MCVISTTVSRLQPGLGNKYPQLQGKSVEQITQMAKSKQLPPELQYLLASRAMKSLVAA